jgi:hypothetical protein
MRALVLGILLTFVLTGCGGSKSDDSFHPIAKQFAQRLVARDFTAAREMLVTPAELQQPFEEMVEPIGKLGEVTITQTMTDWPDKQAGDAGWAYVAIAGELGSEAVTVVVTKSGKIRTVEWGRP